MAIKYNDIRDGRTAEETAKFLLDLGMSPDDIGKNELLYVKTHNLYPEKKGSNLQDLFINNESNTLTELGTSLLNSLGGYKQAVKEGWDESVVGIMSNNKLPEKGSEDFTEGQKIVKNVTSVLSDSPVYFAGGSMGLAGGPVGSAAGAFALEDSMRAVLMDLYKKGEIKSFGDLMDRLKDVDYLNVGFEGLKGGAQGAAVSFSGGVSKYGALKVAKKYKLGEKATKILEETAGTSGEVGGLVTSSSLLNWEVPTMEDFYECATTILGLKGAHVIARKFIPESAKKDARVNPTPKENNAPTVEIPTVTTDAIPTDAPQPVQVGQVWNGNPMKLPNYPSSEPNLVQTVAGNLMDNYAKTGQKPQEAIAEAAQNPNKFNEIVMGKEEATTDKEQPKEKEDTPQQEDSTEQQEKAPSEEQPATPEDDGVDVEALKREANANEEESAAEYDNAVNELEKDIGTSLSENVKKSLKEEMKKEVAEEEKNMKRSDIYLGDKAKLNVSYDPNWKEAPVSLADIADEFKSSVEKFTETKFKKGKMYKRQSVRGFYRHISESIRTRDYNDISVLIHESAHHIDKVFSDFSQFLKAASNLTKKDIDDIKAEFKGIQSKGDVFKEGFAEFVSGYVMDPEGYQKKAPKFYKVFEEVMPKEVPEYYDILKKTQEKITKWRMQPSNIRNMSNIAFEPKKPKVSLKKLLDAMYTGLVDNLHPLKVMRDEVMKTHNERRKSKGLKEDKLDPSEDPYLLAINYAGVDSKIQNFLTNKTIRADGTQNGESLRDILKDLPEDEYKEFNNFLVLSRIRGWIRKGNVSKTGYSLRDIETELNALNGTEKGKRFTELARRVNQYLDRVLQYAKEKELITDEEYYNFKEKNPFYVPFYRESDGMNDGIKKGLLPKRFMRIKGSDKKIIPVLENIVKYTSDVIKAADRQEIANAVVSLAHKTGSGRYVENVREMQKQWKPKGYRIFKDSESPMPRFALVEDPLTTPAGENPNLVFLDEVDSIWENKKSVDPHKEIMVTLDGKRRFFEMDEDVAELLNGIQAPLARALETIIKTFGLNKPASWLRAGTTLSPSFIESNVIRDTQEAFINSENGFIPIISNIEAVFDMRKHPERVREWENAGGDMSQFIPKDRKTVKENIRAMTKSGYATAAWNSVKYINPLWYAEEISRWAENTTRYWEFMKGNKNYSKELSDYDAKLLAAYKSRDLTLNFARHGAWLSWLNSTIPFLNAKIQGIDKMIRNAKSNPRKAALAYGIPILIAYANALYYKDDEDIQDVNRAIRDSNWIYKFNDRMIKIAKPETLIPATMIVERMAEKNDDDFLSFMARMANQVGGFNLIPTVALPAYETATNKSQFFEKELIPAWLERLQPEYQYTESTSETSKWVAKHLAPIGIHTSPIILDQYIRDWTGSLGTGTLRLLEGKNSSDPYSFEHNMFFKAFLVAYPSRSNSEAYKSFMEGYKDFARKANTFNYTTKNSKDGIALEYAVEASTVAELNKIHEMILEKGKFITLVSEDENMTKDEKRSDIDKISRDIITLSKKGNSILKTLNGKADEWRDESGYTRYRIPTTTNLPIMQSDNKSPKDILKRNKKNP